MRLWKRKEDPEKQAETLHCSFCGKPQLDVRKLIAGPSVQICDECVGICVDVLSDNNELSSGDPPQTAVKCALCSRVIAEPLQILDRGVLCQGCAFAVQSMTIHTVL